MKACKKCGATKPLEDFYRAAGTRDGHRGDCKVCSSEDKRRRYLADPEAAIARVKALAAGEPGASQRHTASAPGEARGQAT